MLGSRRALRILTVLAFTLGFACPVWSMLDAGVFVPTGSAAITGPAPAITPLANGKVLIVGNGSAQLYDPASGTWTPAATPPIDGTWSAAALLASGKALVTGGEPAGVSTAATALYDPATNTWGAGPDMSSPRTRHTATVLANGKVLLSGGWKSGFGALNTADLYDPATNTISPTGSFSGPRFAHRAVLMNNGKVLLAGGYLPALPSASIYDPAAGSWSAAASMNTPRSYFAVANLASGKILVSGGVAGATSADSVASAEVYDPAANSWTPVSAMQSVRYGHSMVALSDGQAVAIGGAAASAEIYDPVANVWKAAGFSAASHAFVDAVKLFSGAILVAPGELYRPVLPRAKTDFSGDGKSDIVFENGAGTRWLYVMNGAAVAGGGLLPGPAPGWTLAGIGDFDGNGTADFLWSNTANPAQFFIWLMNGTSIIGGGPVSVTPGYRPTFIADFDADGKDDILWEHPSGGRWFYFMNGSAVASAAPVPAASPGWEIIGVGNFDGAHGADLLWVNTQHPGSYWIYLMNGARVIGGGPVAVAPGFMPTWIGDMNRDGRDDIIWENGTSQRWVYMMNGAGVLSTALLPVPSPGWTLVGVGDYDSAQGVDLLWQNNASPAHYFIYLLNTSAAMIAQAPLSVAPGYQALSHAIHRPPGWFGRVSCAKKLTHGTSVTGVNCPSANNVPDETHDWYVGGPQVGTSIPTYFVAVGSWCQGQWTINTSTSMQMTFTQPSGLPTFDRTSNFFSTPYVGLPLQQFHEFDFQAIQGPLNSTGFSGQVVYNLAPGDVPTIAGEQGTVTCTWNFRLQ